MPLFTPEKFCTQFPLIHQPDNGANNIQVYFDNAATTQKMLTTIEAEVDYYQRYNANVHRAAHQLSAKATEAFEKARDITREFIGAQSVKEIIWTKGTTESINLVAHCLAGSAFIQDGDEILVSYSEHHSNIVPWQLLAQKVNATLKVIPLDAEGRIDVSAYQTLLSEKTKLVAVTHISNVVGKVNDLASIIQSAKKVAALTLIDGAQALAHCDVNVKRLDCDFYAFSAHKCYGPTGVGVLYGKEALLNQLPPYQAGGEMVDKVSFSGTTFNQLPFKFEAGTPNIAGAIAFGSALKALMAFNVQDIHAYEQKLTAYAYQQLITIKGLRFLFLQQPDVGIFAFTLDGIHYQDVAAFLDAHGVYVRSGSHCAMPLMSYCQLQGCVRVSLAPYNTFAEIDSLVALLTQLMAEHENHLEQAAQLDVSAEVPSVLGQVNAEKHKLTISPSGDVLSDESQTILIEMQKSKAWDSKHRLIMLYGKKLPRLAKEWRNQASLISGCESQAWLIPQHDENGRLSFICDSDVKVIRGLLYIATAPYQHKTPAEILAFDIKDYFEQMGLLQHLSPSRGNGLLAIVEKIKALAAQA